MERLRQRADFLAAAAGRKAPVAGFVLQALERPAGGPARIGFTASKKVGNAVERNRARRRLRELVRVSAHRPHPGYDYVLIARSAALNLPFGRLTEDLGRALSRVHGGGSRPASPHAGAR